MSEVKERKVVSVDIEDEDQKALNLFRTLFVYFAICSVATGVLLVKSCSDVDNKKPKFVQKSNLNSPSLVNKYMLERE